MNILRRLTTVRLCPTLHRGWMQTVLMSSGGAEVTASPEDALMGSIKYSTDTVELFDVVAKQKKEMQSTHVMQTLKTLFVLQKNGNSRLSTDEILKHPEFENICRCLRSHSRGIELNDIIDALKVLIFLRVPTNSEIVHILFNLLRHQINDIELGQMVFLDFLLERCQKTPLIEAFNMSLPMLFQISVGTKLDHENVPELADLLAFAVKHECSDKSIQNVVSALTLHGDNIHIDQAKSIVWSLCDLRRFHPSHERLLQNCMNVLVKNIQQLKFLDIECALSKISYKILHRYPSFYREDFFEKTIDVAIERDIPFNLAVYCFKKFNRISYTSDRLLEVVAKKFTDVEDASPSIIFTLVTAFSMANYIPMNWDVMSQSIAKSKLLRNPTNNLPWLKFVVEFVSLGAIDENLLTKIFSDTFLSAFLARDNPTLDYMQLLSLYQILTILHPHYTGPLPDTKYIDRSIEIIKKKGPSPLGEPLKCAFGEEFVVNRAVTQHGHLIDHLIAFDEQGNTVPIARGITDEYPQLEQFFEKGWKLVAVLPLTNTCYSSNTSRLKGVVQAWIDTLTAIGLKTLPVNIDSWSQFADHEKIPYLEREIRHCVQ